MDQVFNTVDREAHRRYRRVLGGALSESGLKAWQPNIESMTKLAIDKMAHEAATRRDGVVDVFKWWMFMSTDIIGRLSFSQSFDMLERAEKNQHIHDLESIAQEGALRITFPTLVTIGKYLRLPLLTDAAAAAQRLEHYADESVARHMKHAEAVSVSTKAFGSISPANQGEALTIKGIKDNAQAYIVAGSDTVANTLTYLVWAVCSRPLIRDRLAAEVLAVNFE
jgi:cytochrome P450